MRQQNLRHTTQSFNFQPQEEDKPTLVLYKLEEKHYCSCKALAATFCSTCQAWLCRNHSLKWHEGKDFCLLHLPESRLGSIIVGSIRFYDLTDGIYIGREVTTPKEHYPASLLGNPYKITKNSTTEDKQRALYNYRTWLNQQRLAKGEVYFHLLDLRDFVLRGIDLSLLCWCKGAEGEGICHGDIVAACLEWMVGQVRKTK